MTNSARHLLQTRRCAICSDPNAGAPNVAVSVAIPTYNSEAYLELAVRSALDQTIDNIEVIIVDDCSTDSTFTLSQSLARADGRIRIERLPQNGGPSVARNRALELAQGRWFAVLDSDDLFARDRLERLVAVGEAQGADLVADNLVVFDGYDPSRASFFLDLQDCSSWLDLDSYLQRTVMHAEKPNFGYLKPLIKLNSLKSHGVRYKPALRIAEDDDFIVRLLASGLSYWLDPRAMYAYRRHAASTSHRLSASHAMSIVHAGRQLASEGAHLPPNIKSTLRQRLTGFERSASFARLREAMKQRRFADSVGEVVRNPQVLPMLGMPLTAALRRTFGIPAASEFGKPDPHAAAAIAEILSGRGVSL